MVGPTVAVSRDDAPSFICDFLAAHASLDRSELSARWVAKKLGQTTGFLYHHWGSFDAFLLDVSGLGWKRLVASLARAYERKPTLAVLLESYIDFASSKPVLYWLMAERALSPELLREQLGNGRALPSFEGLKEMIILLARALPGVTLPQARALHAAIHGLASQMLSNRLGSMPDTFGHSERKIAGEIAIEIGRLFAAPDATEPRASRSPAGDPTAASPPRRRTKTRRSSSSR